MDSRLEGRRVRRRLYELRKMGRNNVGRGRTKERGRAPTQFPEGGEVERSGSMKGRRRRKWRRRRLGRKVGARGLREREGRMNEEKRKKVSEEGWRREKKRVASR